MPITPHSVILINLMLSTAMTAMSNSWFTAWLSLEMNTLVFLPIISKTKHPQTAVAATKYFLTQTFASCLLLFSSALNAWYTGTWSITQLDNKTAATLMLLALTMKAAAAPTHFWLPEVMQGCTMTTATLISVWQKIVPTILILSMYHHAPSNITIIAGLLSTASSGFGGIDKTQLWKTITYAAITNMGWMLLILASQPKTSMMALLLYMAIITSAMLMMEKNSTKTLKNMEAAWSTSPTLAILAALMLLSASELLPLTDLMPKLIALGKLVPQNLAPLAVVATTTTFFILLLYLRTMLPDPSNSAASSMKWRQQVNAQTMMLAPIVLTTTFSLTLLTG
uniref:NADH-ubiquinone oxidoreductase chain 2 n=1 Tax=Pseudocalotes flavigula TaxID=118227 RepID=A0A1B1R2Q8_9SAUR|nr:NADH dehydrogenase subunit 2 [Pseudocalotes flavigula]